MNRSAALQVGITHVVCPILLSAVSLLGFFSCVSGEPLVEDRLKEQPDASVTSPVGPRGVSFAYEITRDKQSVRARYAGRVSDWKVDIQLESPVGDDDEETEIADLDGLTDNTSLSLGIARFFGGPRPSQRLWDLEDRIIKIVSDSLGVEFDRTSDVFSQRYIDTLKTFDPGLYEELSRAYERESWNFWVGFIGVETKIGQKGFDFLDPVTLGAQSTQKTSYAVSGYAGVLTPCQLLLQVGYRHERYHRGQSRVDLCVPLEGTSAMTCTPAVLGAPSTTEANIVHIEARKYVGRIGLNPRVSYDLDEEITGAEWGFYFLPNRRGILIGGVRIGWRSDVEEITGALVIGGAFRFLD